MNKIILISLFSILTLNVMAQEKIVQTAGRGWYLLIIPGASHCDLYDGGKGNCIPWDKLEVFFKTNLP